jgi:hypothetical protein
MLLAIFPCLFAWLLSGTLAYGQASLDGPVVKCHKSETTKQVQLLVRDVDSPDSWIRLVEFRFPRVATFDQIDSCRAWVMATLSSKVIDWTKAKYKVYPKSEIGDETLEARLVGEDAETLYSACHKSDRCTLSMPFSVHWSLWSDLFIKTEPSMPAHCYDTISKPRRSSLPIADPSQLAYHDLGVVSHWREPQENIVDAIIKMTSDTTNQTIVISTMQWSYSQLLRLKQHFSPRKIKAYVVGDLEVWLSSRNRNPRELEELSDNQFIIVPAFRTLEGANNSHHIKGAILANDSGDFLFTSTNVTSGDDSKYVELGIHGRNIDFAGDFLLAITDLVADYCVERARLSCVLPNYIVEGDYFHFEAEKMLANACKEYFRDESLRRVYANREKTSRMITTEKFNVITTITTLVSSAKESVVGVTAQLSQAAIIEAFNKQDTIPKKIFVGEMSTYPYYKAGVENPHFNVWSNILSPHTKAIVVDDKLLFWGSGNFTQTGVTSPREVFTLISDKKAIAIIKDFIQSVELSGPRK